MTRHRVAVPGSRRGRALGALVAVAVAVATTPTRVSALLPTIAAVPGHPFVTLEHVNLNIPDVAEAARFWKDGLGFVEDSRAAASLQRTQDAGGESRGLLWANVGLQQIHLPVESPSQTLRGQIEVAYGSSQALEEVASRLEALGFAAVTDRTGDDGGGALLSVRTTDQQGTRVLCRLSTAPVGSTWFGPAANIPPSPATALPSLDGTAALGVGVQAVRLDVPPGAAAAICAFYRTYFHAETARVEPLPGPDVEALHACVLPVGHHQTLMFAETAAPLPEYDGHHVAVYVNDFEASYARLKRDGLVWNNPRFPQFTYDTLEDALTHDEFRFRTFVDVDAPGRPVVYELEHEVRSLKHPGFCCPSFVPQQRAAAAAAEF